MQAALSAVTAYRHTHVQSRLPLELVVMLYDGALSAIIGTREAIARRDLIARRDCLSRALAIVTELQSTLNVVEGGEIARSLDDLYSYVTHRLVDVNVKYDTAALDEVERLLRPLRDAWAQIADGVTAEGSARVNAETLLQHLSTYAAGLEAELSLLRQVKRLATVQAEAGRDENLERLHQVADERDRLMAGLVRIEEEIRESRHVLAANRDAASGLPGFAEVAALHRTAGALVSAIAESDDATVRALKQAEVSRSTAAKAIEVGETTLAAYRRVIAPTAHTPSLVDRRG